jgi:hypothetical protein
MRSLILKIMFVLLFPAFFFVSAAHAQTPTYANNGHSCAFGGPHTATGLICPLPNPAGSGNAIVLFALFTDTQTGTVGATDDKSNTYTCTAPFDDAANHGDLVFCVAPNVAAGATQVQLTLTGNTHTTTTTQMIVAEFFNVATSVPIDGTTFNGNTNNTASVTTASTTPAGSGELLLMAAFSDSGNATGWTVGSQSNITWKLRSALADASGTLPAQAFQYGVYNSAAAITPTMSNSGGANWVAASIFLKAATAGTAPAAGARVSFDNGIDLNSMSTGAKTIQFAHYGNTPVMMYLPGGGTFTTTGTPTESCGNTIILPTGSPFTPGGDSQWWGYMKNASSCGAGTLSWTFAGTNQSASMHLYDVEGGDTVNPICDNGTTNILRTASGNQGSGNNLPVATVAMTPCRAGSAAMWAMGIGDGGAIGLTAPAGGTIGSCIPRPYQPLTECDENNGFAVHIAPSTSSFTWTMQPEQAPLGIQGWSASSLAVQPPAPAGSQPTVAIAPPSVTFGNVQVGAFSPTTDIQISNTSTNGDSLTINSFVMSGGNTGDFFAVTPLTGSPACNLSTQTTVTPGTSCFIGVNFKPTGAGSRSSSLVFGDNAAGGQGSVPLSGSGTSSSAASIAATAGTSQSAKINTAYAAALQATVKDSGGTGVSGVSVTFTAPASGASGTFSGAASVTVTTDTSGIASAPAFTANSTAGTYAVNATTPGVGTPAVFTLTNTPGSAATIAVTAGTPQSAAIGAPFATLQAIVRDTGGNGVAGVTVTFTAPATGASGTFPGGLTAASAVTDASGLANAPTFTANATVGIYSVNATLAGLASPATFSLTNLASAPASIAASSGTPQSVVISTAFAALKAAVMDSGGNAVSGATVTFTAPASGASGTFAGGMATTAVITDASGVATAPTFTANATAGSYTVNAKVAGVATPAAFSLTNLPGVPTVSTLSPASTTAGGTAFTLSVNGTKFVATSVVNFNGAAKTTTFVSATQLTAAITAADIANAGLVNVNVSTPAPGGGMSANLTFTISNPQPVLSSLSPTSATAGSAAFTLTVNGNGFVNGATVSFNGTTKTTTFVSNTRLTAAIAAADINTAGAANVGVTNPGPTGGTSLALVFMINNPQPAIATATSSGKTHAPGGAALTLVVNGTGFLPASTVNFGAKAEPTTFVSATQLTAAIPAGDVATAGNVNVSVTNPTPGGGTAAPAAVFTVDGYTLTGPGTASTVAAGQQATIQLTVTPGANGFSNGVTLSVSGLPANTSATLSPTSVTPNGASATATLNIMTTPRGAAAPPSSPVNMPLPPWLVPALVLWLAALLAGRFTALQLLRIPPRVRRYAAVIPLALLLLAGGVLSGCSGITAGPKTTNGTPAGTSQLTVTATSGTMVQNATVTLTVQ